MPDAMRDLSQWWEILGGFCAGLLGLRGLQVWRNRPDQGGLDALIDAMRKEHAETRRILHQLDTRIQVLSAVLEDARLDQLAQRRHGP